MVHLLIQGPPRSGKTTLVEALLDSIKKDYCGFITREVRGNHGNRIGFDVIDLSIGQTIPLARKSWDTPLSIASYGVDVEGFGSYIQDLDVDAQVVIIDEIGKMELLYDGFLDWVGEQLEQRNVIATIPSSPPRDLEQVLEEYDYDLVTISKDTRDEVRAQAMVWIQKFGT